MTVARVLPNVTGLDKEFDYLVPDAIGGVAVGDLVRVDLHGRRVGGWVVAVDPPDALEIGGLKPIAKITGHGPSPELVELAGWAAVRWAGRRRHFLVAGSPDRAVDLDRGTEPHRARRRATLAGVDADPRGRRRCAAAPPDERPQAGADERRRHGPAAGGRAVRRPGDADGRGDPSIGARPSLSCPHDWASAAGGVDVVIGGRSAAFAPCPGLAAAVVVDEHDEALQEEGSPTWHARDVLIERARRAGAPVLLISPCPTLEALEFGSLTRPPHEREREGWPIVEVVDRTGDEPWKRSLLTSELIRHLRDPERSIVCVYNTTGRARLLACRQCRTLARCERCDAAVGLSDELTLACGRCGLVRPAVCSACGASRFANLRPGVSRLREEIEAAANRPAVLVTGDTPPQRDGATIHVGTEAVLHRVERADTVAFLDFDRELLAPRFRASEQAMALLARAARLVGPRRGVDGSSCRRSCRSTPSSVPPCSSDPGRLVEDERARRRMLGLPPFGALAEISGAGSDEFVGSLPECDLVIVAGDDNEYVARSTDWMTLGSHLNQGVRPPGSRLRIAVDPGR